MLFPDLYQESGFVSPGFVCALSSSVRHSGSPEAQQWGLGFERGKDAKIYSFT